MIEGFIGRVPVYDRNLELFAYELRPCSTDISNAYKRDELIKQAWESVRLEQITGGRKGIINLPAVMLPEISHLPWPKDQIIVTLTENDLSAIATDKLATLAKEGLMIAISSNRFDPGLVSQHNPAKFWCLNADDDLSELEPFAKSLHQQGFKLFARNIETREQYDALFEAQVDYFQGQYFERPRMIHGTQIPANRLAILQLIARLQDPDITIDEVESLVHQDMTLSYKLLRMINAAFFGLPNKVESIRRAVVFLGLQRIKHWAIVIVVNAIDYKPRELLISAVVRARTGEQMAASLKRRDLEQCYIAGLFSLLDAIMDAPMEEILKHLNLTQDINDALLYGTGPIGEILQSTLALEQGLCNKIPVRDLDLQSAMHIYLETIAWAEEIRKQLQQAA